MSLKPAFRVPSMDEIRALPWNGYRVASTFAGGGGSSTGYRMAGYRVVWANELVPVARASYAANMDDKTILEGRDIRALEASDIFATTGLKPGELDIFDGSPPCVSFSTSGRREKGWGKVTQSGEIQQRHDDLFFEYARLLRELQPKVFVAENVSGLVKGTAKGYFLEILAALKACGYRVEAQLLDAQWLGVPQARQRLIFLGVREDLGLAPVFPAPLGYRYSMRDALPALQARYLMLGNPGWAKRPDLNFARGQKVSFDRPCLTVGSTENVISGTPHYIAETSAKIDQCRRFSIDEIKRLCGFPDDYALRGNHADQWARCGNAVPPVMMFHIASVIRDRILERISTDQAARCA